MTAISVATPMVRPSMVSEARSLGARRASAARNTLSRKFSMHLWEDFALVPSDSNDKLFRRFRLERSVYALTVDLDRARIDLAPGIAHRLGKADLGEQFVPAHAAAGPVGGFRKGDGLDILRRFVLHFAVELLLSVCGIRGRVEVRHNLPRQLLLGLLRVELAAPDVWAQLVELRQGAIGEQFVVAVHQTIADLHHLAVHDLRRFGDADVVAQRFGHLVDAIQAFEQGHGGYDL